MGCRPNCCSLPVLCACCSYCRIDLPGCDLIWRTCCRHVQVQRASGAFMVSHRRQSMGLPVGLGPPGLTGPAGAVMETTSSMASEDVEAAEGSLADDEEFVAEQHAHRCMPCHHMCDGCRPLLWALRGEHRVVISGADTLRTAYKLALRGPRAVQKWLLPTHRSCVLQPYCLPPQSRHQRLLPTWHLHPANVALVPHPP